MRDVEIRAALDKRLRDRFEGSADTVIRHELGVCAGQRRVDLAVINGHLDGWEIKSDEDSLRRLDGQVDAYSAVLDRSWLVATERHFSHAADRLPSWWGLVIVTPGPGGWLRLKQVRRPRQSPVLDSMSIAQLLWREEALELLRNRGLAKGLSGSARWYVWERLAASLPQRELRAEVRSILRARREWPGGQPPS